MPPPILLLDGGLGTSLESLPNKSFNTSTPLWSSHLLITSPSTLLAVHKSFVDNGADVILTATYQSSVAGFQATKINSSDKVSDEDGVEISAEQAAAYMCSAVPLARSAFTSSEFDGDGKGRGTGRIALSLGAYGATMQPSTEYTGHYSPPAMQTVEGLKKWHEERLAVFRRDAKTWEDIDFVAFETLPVVEEIKAVREVMTDVDKKWWISCVFPGAEVELPDGTGPEACVAAMLGGQGPKPWGIGVNCTEVGKIPELVLRFEKAMGKIVGKSEEWPWLVMYPDGAKGEVYNPTTQHWERKDGGSGDGIVKPWNEEVLGIVEKARNEGLWAGILIGGCCKTTAEDIGKLRLGIDKLLSADEKE